MKMRGHLVRVIGDIADNKAEFECRNGHRFVGPILPKKPKGVGAQGLRMLASWWTKEKGGVTLNCPVCKTAVPPR